MGHFPDTNPFGKTTELCACTFPRCPYVTAADKKMHHYVAVATAADTLMHHFAASPNESSFTKICDALEALRVALVAAGYGLPGEQDAQEVKP